MDLSLLDVRSIAVLCVAGVAGGVCLKRWVYPTPALPAFDRSERLNFKEQLMGVVLQHADVKTLTLLRGDTPANIFRSIRHRAIKILQANPWLAGEIRVIDGAYHMTWRDEISEETAGSFIENVGIDEELSTMMSSVGEGGLPSFSEMCCAVRERYGVKRRPDGCSPLLKIFVAEVEGGCLLIVAVNHGVADGATYYAIRNMLSEAVPIRSLRTKRTLMENDPILRRFFPKGVDEECIWGILLRFIISAFQDKIDALKRRLSLKVANRSIGVFSVNSSVINAEKKEKCGNEDYISSNDVLTSWWFNSFGTHMRAMVVNMRGRGVDEGLAGNYFTNLVIDPRNDTQTPARIRGILTRGHDKPALEMSLFKKVADPLTMISNWRTFHRPIAVGTAVEALHLPVVEVLGMGNIAIIFQLDANRIGVECERDPFCSADIASGEGHMMQTKIMSG